VQQVPLVYPTEDFGIPRWSPSGEELLISTILRFDALGNVLPFVPATVDLRGPNFNLLEPPNAGFDAGCFGGWSPDATGFSAAAARAHRVNSASAPPMEAIRCD
jgi:hypothetical protein